MAVLPRQALPRLARWRSASSRPDHVAVFAAAFLAMMLTGGCASPGVPRPPSLHLPAPVRDLRAVRNGDVVDLSFSAPTETTDKQSLTGRHGAMPMTAVLCRVEAARCIDVTRLAVAPGQPYRTQDVLPPALTLGAPRRLLYRVRVLNPAGRDAGPSRPVLTAAGVAPPAVTGLAADTVAQGVRLTWQRSSRELPVRVEAQASSATAGGIAPRLLRVPAGSPADPGGAVDAAATVGTPVRYRVYRQQQAMLDGDTVPLNGIAATVTATRGPDVFPPAMPTGLIAVSAGPDATGAGVSLSWEPNTEPDVVGYRVYRATRGGAFVRVSTVEVRGVSFQDSAVPPGAYRYEVAAVDRAGNESAHSAPAEVSVP